ncbi:hypothetical protein [Erwinia typographi]|uniref:hypothetical protein n=1 Tax=Erwinia typographi TaxID=371042 RepID=UPI000907D81D|nr:hypothetical protein [Erwinia typographi]
MLASNDAKTDAEVKAATIELQSKLITLQTESFTLGDVIRLRDEEAVHLKTTIAEFENFKSESEGYVLNQLDSGTFVYSKKQIVNESETTVHLCLRCFSKREISILQPVGEVVYDLNLEMNFHKGICHGCKAFFW